jgi:hypothetical protein
MLILGLLIKNQKGEKISKGTMQVMVLR